MVYLLVRHEATGCFLGANGQQFCLSDSAGDTAMWVNNKDEIYSATSEVALHLHQLHEEECDNTIPNAPLGNGGEGVLCQLRLCASSTSWLSVGSNGYVTLEASSDCCATFMILEGPEDLPSAHLAEMRSRGYTVLPRVLSLHAALFLREELVQETLDNSRNGAPFGIGNLLSKRPEVAVAVARAVTHPVALWLFKEYLGHGIDGEDDVMFSHPPSAKVIQPVDAMDARWETFIPSGWHSDYPYKVSNFPELKWPTDLRLAVQYNVCIDAFRTDNAATQFVPFSHLSGRFPPSECNNGKIKPGEADTLLADATQFEAPAGAAVLYDSRLWHRACPERNVSGSHRVAQLNAVTKSWIQRTCEYGCYSELDVFFKSGAFHLLSAREQRDIQRMYLREPTTPPQNAVGHMKSKPKADNPFTKIECSQGGVEELCDVAEPLEASDIWQDVAYQMPPVLICLHPGGVNPKMGEQLMEPLLSAAAGAGIKEHLVLSYPEAYGFMEAADGTWSDYIDKLLSVIGKHRWTAGRRVFIWGFQNAGAVAFSLAVRLGERVVKVYLLASDAPRIPRSSGHAKEERQCQDWLDPARRLQSRGNTLHKQEPCQGREAGPGGYLEELTSHSGEVPSNECIEACELSDNVFERIVEDLSSRSDEDSLRIMYECTPQNGFLKLLIGDLDAGKLDISKSAAIRDMIELSKRMYIYKIFPDLRTDFTIISAPILAFNPQEIGSSTESGWKPCKMEAWREWTTGSFSMQVVDPTAIASMMTPPKKSRKGQNESSNPCEIFERTVADMALHLRHL